MKTEKTQKLNAKGWKVGSTEDFLDLSAEEVAYIDLKISLGKNLKARRKQKKITQMELAKILKSDQARIASSVTRFRISLLARSADSPFSFTSVNIARVISYLLTLSLSILTISAHSFSTLELTPAPLKN